ncbi:hypothetical protein KUCAC02_002614 [Chaenocephalus aceratus]|uniref:Uncharacterized protein n=1 Tax=Chaenocephalus aceratus TaxID=36190 RepID=A0ACB9XVI7_CHAAC|nr:hypothetical protein KUCAC02_002614 [Chaenocephalus aceratus]
MGKDISTPLAPPKDQRGRHAPANKLDQKPLHEHIESFHPTVSHYRREHAPWRRYLPSDISMKLMYADYIEKDMCSYESYRKAVKSLNISFTKLGEEQYSARESKLHYQSDAERDWPEDTSTRSVDLQKVIMLPRMPGVKSAVFTRRIVAYHETFVSVGKKTNKKNTISVVWHEGIAGRSAAEITSAYAAALEKERDIKHIVYWVDNCSSQNKNWCLFSSLVSIVNSQTISTEDITLKFFQPGHTFMSADSFHHGVEQEMKSRPGGVVYDF